MSKNLIVLILLAIAACLLVAIVLAADNAAKDKPSAPAAVSAPIVAAVPYKYETEYEQDPFEPDRLRRTRTVVTHVLVIRADGQVRVVSTP